MFFCVRYNKYSLPLIIILRLLSKAEINVSSINTNTDAVLSGVLKNLNIS